MKRIRFNVDFEADDLLKDDLGPLFLFANSDSYADVTIFSNGQLQSISGDTIHLTIYDHNQNVIITKNDTAGALTLANWRADNGQHARFTFTAAETALFARATDYIVEVLLVQASVTTGAMSAPFSIYRFDGGSYQATTRTPSETVCRDVTLGGGGGGSLDPITNFTAAEQGFSSIKLDWDQPTDENFTVLMRSTDSGSTWLPLATPALNAITYTDTGLTNGTRYDYRIASFDNLAVSSAWATAFDTTETASVPLTGLKMWLKDAATNYDTGADEWTDSADVAEVITLAAGTSPTVVADYESTGESALSIPANASLEYTWATEFYTMRNDTFPGAIYCVVTTGTNVQSIVALRSTTPSNDTEFHFSMTGGPKPSTYRVDSAGSTPKANNATQTVPTTKWAGGMRVGTITSLDGLAAIQVSNNADEETGDFTTLGAMGKLDIATISDHATILVLAELLIYDVEIEDTPHAEIMAYLNTKYDL